MIFRTLGCGLKWKRVSCIVPLALHDVHGFNNAFSIVKTMRPTLQNSHELSPIGEVDISGIVESEMAPSNNRPVFVTYKPYKHQIQDTNNTERYAYCAQGKDMVRQPEENTAWRDTNSTPEKSINTTM